MSFGLLLVWLLFGLGSRFALWLLSMSSGFCSALCGWSERFLFVLGSRFALWSFGQAQASVQLSEPLLFLLVLFFLLFLFLVEFLLVFVWCLFVWLCVVGVVCFVHLGGSSVALLVAL